MHRDRLELVVLDERPHRLFAVFPGQAYSEVARVTLIDDRGDRTDTPCIDYHFDRISSAIAVSVRILKTPR
jgi:hypothetical protein